MKIQALVKHSMLFLITAMLFTSVVMPVQAESSMSYAFDLEDLEYDVSSVDVDGQTYTSIELLDESFSTDVGAPKLPMIRKMIEIPQGAEVSIEVQNSVWVEMNIDTLIYPLQPSQEKTELRSEDGFFIDLEAYDNARFSSEIARVIETGVLRGHAYALVEISPVQYDASSGNVRLLESASINVIMTNGDIAQTGSTHQRYATTSFEKMVDAAFENEEMFGSTDVRENEGYLIIVDDSLLTAISPFQTWKSSIGFDVTVAETSSIPGGATTTAIKAYIQDAYDTWPTPPAYVLLVGDTPQIPTYTGSSSSTAADLYYATLDGGDLFPDVHIGRFSCSTPAQVTALIDKTIYYETGNYPDDSFLSKTVFMASTDNYQVSEGTHNYVINNYLDPNGYSSDKLYTVSYGATTQDVTDSFNDGRFLGVYSGHGASTYWADGPYFTQSNVNALTNVGEYPFVCSHACVTGKFTVSECFAETWIRAEDKASIAFWSSSANTLWDEDDILEKRMFQSWFDDQIFTIGGMTDMALYYLYQYYGGSGHSQYYLECYNVLGDPSINIMGLGVTPNEPPTTPTTPMGPTAGQTAIQYSYSSQAYDPEGYDVQYRFDFDDGAVTDWSSLVSSGTLVTMSHTWDSEGTFDVKCQARDLNGTMSQWSDALTVSIVAVNHDPDTPDAPVGPNSLQVGQEGTYEVVGSDPDGDLIEYRMTWGDDFSDWSDPVPSGTVMQFSHAWDEAGTYAVRVQVRDPLGLKSDWSDRLDVYVWIDEPNLPPTVEILSPTDGETVSGTITVSGTAEDPEDALVAVYVTIDGVEYTASGLSSWSLDVDTTEFENGGLVISARSYDGEFYSSVDEITVTVDNPTNTAPLQPSRPSGETEGKKGVEYTYQSSSVDPQGDAVYLFFDWGDGSDSGWVGPVSSGELLSVNHTWDEKGEYEIKVKAKDTLGLESEWSDPLPITMPRFFTWSDLFLSLLEKIVERFPFLEAFLF